MPLNIITMASSLTTSLIGSGMLGIETPKLAFGISIGLFEWTKTLTVQGTAVGTAGVGLAEGSFLIPPSILLPNLLVALPVNSIFGIMMPSLAVGLSTGTSLALAPGVITIPHLSVGSGGGVAKAFPTPATPFLISGLKSVGMKGKGPENVSSALSAALQVALVATPFPIKIVGPPTPAPSSGPSFGSIK